MCTQILLRQLGEALEGLLNQSLPQSHPLRRPLEDQLLSLEGPSMRWRTACEPYLPAAVYKELDSLDKHLRTKADELKRKQTGANFFETAATAATTFGGGTLTGASAVPAPLMVIEALQRTAQRALRELQPADGAEVCGRH